MLSVVEAVVGAVIVILTLSDAFETIVLPRTQQRRYRLTRLIYRGSWWLWASLSEMRISRSRREALLFFYGPTLIILLIVMWAIALIAGFGLVLHAVNNPQAHGESLGTSLYLSGSTFFTLGLGDVVPHTSAARVFAIIEAGTGFGFLAMVISYLPIFYQAFSRREVAISSLDAHAGSPATAIELIRRNDDRVAEDVLREWENWAGQLLESHLSYPILALFRSQHEHQSWLGALTVILDTCALSMTGLRDMSDHQARFTFAIARHALIDLAQVFFADPREPDPPRLLPDGFEELARRLQSYGFPFSDPATAAANLEALRQQYEPIAFSLSRRLLLDLPPWIPAADARDDSETTPWGTMHT